MAKIRQVTWINQPHPHAEKNTAFARPAWPNKRVISLARKKPDRTHKAQLLNYLKATGIPVGLLIKFRNPKAEIKRKVHNLPEGQATK
ncbi:MAG: GxxExxY protein [Desulfobacteraceae bacterium]|jgi:hypothetical protein